MLPRHAVSFAGLGFLSWYLAGKLHLFDRRGHQFKAWLALTPLVGALLVAISRYVISNFAIIYDPNL